MKNISFRTLTALLTFAVGVCAVFVWLYYSQKQSFEISLVADEVPPVALSNYSCVNPKSFPGLSRKIGEIPTGKSGYFPKNSWKAHDTADHFMNDWYGKFLKEWAKAPFLMFPMRIKKFIVSCGSEVFTIQFSLE